MFVWCRAEAKAKQINLNQRAAGGRLSWEREHRGSRDYKLLFSGADNQQSGAGGAPTASWKSGKDGKPSGHSGSSEFLNIEEASVVGGVQTVSGSECVSSPSIPTMKEIISGGHTSVCSELEHLVGWFYPITLTMEELSTVASCCLFASAGSCTEISSNSFIRSFDPPARRWTLESDSPLLLQVGFVGSFHPHKLPPHTESAPSIPSSSFVVLTGNRTVSPISAGPLRLPAACFRPPGGHLRTDVVENHEANECRKFADLFLLTVYRVPYFFLPHCLCNPPPLPRPPSVCMCRIDCTSGYIFRPHSCSLLLLLLRLWSAG